MSRVIKDGGIVEDRSLIILTGAHKGLSADSDTFCFLPLGCWLDALPTFEVLRERPGVWLESRDRPDALEPYLPEVPAIAIRFDSFADGTGFSTGALLREAYGFEGELRAFGDLIADQTLQLRRCGFNVISLKAGEDLDAALAMLLNAQLSYQGSVFSPRTPFKFRF